MGIKCSSGDNGNHGEGFNPGNNDGNSGFNPGNNGGQGGFHNGGDSHRPHSRSAGPMAPNGAMEEPKQQEAADPQRRADADAIPHGNLMSPQLGAASPQQPPAPQENAPQNNADASQGRPWIDFDPRTGKPMLAAGQVGFQEHGGNIPLNNVEANRQAWEEAAGAPFQEAAGAPFNGQMYNHNSQDALPPQLGQPYENHMILGALSGDLSNGTVVQEGHWKEFEAANNVMSLEEFQATQL